MAHRTTGDAFLLDLRMTCSPEALRRIAETTPGLTDAERRFLLAPDDPVLRAWWTKRRRAEGAAW